MKTKRTESDRQDQYYREMHGQIRSIYRRARQAGHPHAWILEQCQRLYASDTWRKLQSGYKSQIHAINGTLLDELFERDLIWRLGPASGPIRNAGDEWTAEMSELSRTPGALYGAHFYTAHPDKAFNPYAPTNAPRPATAQPIPEPAPVEPEYFPHAIGRAD